MMPEEPNNLERQPRRAEPPVNRDVPIGHSAVNRDVPIGRSPVYQDSYASPGMRGSVAGFYILLLVCCLALIGIGGILLTRQHALQSSLPHADSPEQTLPASDPNNSTVVVAPASPAGPANTEAPSDTALAPAALPTGKEALAHGSSQVEYPVPPAPTLTPVAPSSPPPDPDAPPSPVSAPSSPIAATNTANTSTSSASTPAVPADNSSPITPNGVTVGGTPAGTGSPAAASPGDLGTASDAGAGNAGTTP